MSNTNNVMSNTNNVMSNNNNLMSNNEVYIGIEGSVWDWCDWPAAEQELYVEMLSKADGVLYSNEYDKEMIKALKDLYQINNLDNGNFKDEVITFLYKFLVLQNIEIKPLVNYKNLDYNN
jgi:hypothetical protein